MMAYHEYPKVLYRGEAFCLVHDADQEQAQRAQGWHDFATTPALAAAPARRSSGRTRTTRVETAGSDDDELR